MANKVTRLAALLLVLAATAAASILYVDPGAPAPLTLAPAGQPAAFATRWPSPTGVKIELWPSQAQPDSFRLSWNPTPGARAYRVYSAVCVPDSSTYVPFLELIQDPRDGSLIYSYQYSYHPRFGDPVFERLGGLNGTLDATSWGAPNSRAERLLFSPWLPDTLGYYSAASYTRPNAGERDRMFYVVAIY